MTEKMWNKDGLKELPPEPPPYARPKHRWFECYEYTGEADEMSLTEKGKMIAAMWLTFLDRTLRPLKDRKHLHTIIELQKIGDLVRKYGPCVMSEWRSRCDAANRFGDDEETFKTLFNGWRV